MNQEKPAKKINFTRRDALKFLGAGAATLTAELSPGADLTQQEEVRHSDVVVVGAGFAGMVAARSLIRTGKKRWCWKRKIGLADESGPGKLPDSRWMSEECG